MRLRIPPRRAVTVAVGAVSACYFAFWACAPTSTLPPPVPLADQPQAELYLDNAAAAGWSSWYRVPRDGVRVDYASLSLNAAEGYSKGNGLSFGGYQHTSLLARTDGGGSQLVVGGGGYLRYLPTLTERLAAGFLLQAGLIHAGVGVPLSLRLGQSVWVWTQPTVILEPKEGDTPCYRLPLGISVVMRDRRALTVQANLQRLGYLEITQVGIAVGMGQTIGPGYSTGGSALDGLDGLEALDELYPKPDEDWSLPEEDVD